MGAICILLGCIVFIGSIFGGCMLSSYVLKTASALPALQGIAAQMTPVQVYAICVGVCGFIGLLISLNLIMNGLIYKRVCKLGKKRG